LPRFPQAEATPHEIAVGSAAWVRSSSTRERGLSIEVVMRWVCLVAFAAVLLGGCSTQVLTTPTLALDVQPTLVADPPISLRVVDDESDGRGQDYAGQLAQAIVAAYPRAIEKAPDNSAPVPRRVNMVVRIKQLGAFFHVGSIPVLPSRATLGAVVGSVEDWAPVVKASASGRPAISGTVFIGDGNWSGVAYLEVYVQDLRDGRDAAFRLPLVAERAAPNSLGYMSAKLVADSAWDEIGPCLAAFLDASVRKVAAEAPGARS
jgi:hypothetical protein